MKHFKKFSDDKIQCLLCPRECILKTGQRGFCHVRKNTGKQIECVSYGYTTGLAIDPIEKKPLYHFYPASKVLSFGTLGCNLGCLFCQNYSTTKSREDEKTLLKASPELVVLTASKYGCKSIAFTYNDPVVFYEYALDTAKLAQERGIKTVAVSAGYLNLDFAKEFFAYIDAVNIDLKAFSNQFYEKNCFAKLEKILEIIRYVANETNSHLELTNLLIEEENTDTKQIKEMCLWIVDNIGGNIPLHFSAFHPAWKMLEKPITSKKTLLKAYEIAQNIGLKYIYTGNIWDFKTSTTYCKNCSKPLILRNGFEVIENNLLPAGKCPDCFTKCDGVF